MQELLNFANHNDIKSIAQVYSVEDSNKIISLLRENNIFLMLLLNNQFRMQDRCF